MGSGNITNNGTLVLNRSGVLTFDGTLSGSGTLTKIGPSSLTLNGAQTSTGLTTIANGTLRVDGSISGAVQVSGGGALTGTLGGTGTIGGAVTIDAGGHLAPGDSPGTLRVGSLVLTGGSILDYELGLQSSFAGGVNDLTIVDGNLTLDGTLNIIDVGGFGAREFISPGVFGPGVYRLFEYGGTLTDNGLDLGPLPVGFAPGDLPIQTAIAGQVNLIVSSGGAALQFWDGPNETGNGAIDGGTATWNASSARWTDSNGSANSLWQGGFAVFQGPAGTVTLGENVAFSGLQFATDGNRIEGAGFALQISSPTAAIRVTNGTATINAPITDRAGGSSRLIKTDAGLLVLGGANTYSGGTTISGGALQVASDSNLGAASGDLVLNDGTLITTGTFASARVVTLQADGGTFSPAGGTTLTLNGAIGGAGQLRKDGTGTVVLNGANAFGGGTLLNAGVLQAASDAALGDGAGRLDFNGGTLRLGASFDPAVTRVVTLDSSSSIDTNGFTSTFAQSISGVGALTKLGAGTLTLAADNGYSGGTTISAGTLQIGNGGAAGNVVGDVTNNGALTFKRSDEFAYGGIVSGSGALTQAGSGTLIFSEDQSYSGGTTIASGTLQLGNGGTAGLVIGNIVDNGALVFNRSDPVTFDGIISGTGSVTQSAESSVALTGANTYTGRTTIVIGTLQLGNGGTTGSVAGNITNDGSLIVNRSDAATYAGVIDGTGALIQAGSGTLILTQNQAYTGGTTISAGTLQLGNGGTGGSVVGDMVNNGTLAFNRSDDVVHAGAIEGTGNVVKNALNTLILTGTSAYTGTTTVNAGRLQVEGMIASPVNVMAAGTLGGNGGVGAIVNAGQVSPGASIGTLTVAGHFSQAPSGTLDIELDDRGGVDVLSVSGAATLAGRVAYLPDQTSAFAQDQLYTYLTAGAGVTGTFSNSLQTYAGAIFGTIYNADSVQVQVNSIPLTSTIDPGAGNLVSCIDSLNAQRSATLTPEAAATLGALVTTPVAEFVQAAVETCPRDASVIPAAVHAGTTARFAQLTNRIGEVQRSIEDPSAAGLFDSYRLREGVGLWLRGSYQDGEGDARDVLRQGYDSYNSSLVLGLDVALAEAGVIGGYLARNDLQVSYRGAVSETAQADVDGWTVGVYGSYWSASAWFVQGMIEYGWRSLESSRDISLNTLALQANGDWDARSFATAVGAGYSFRPAASWLIQPQLNVNYERFAEDGYSETGAQALNLTYGDVTAETLRAEAGFTVRKSIIGSAGPTPEITVLYIYANYVYDRALDDRDQSAQFAIAQPFEMVGDEGTRDGIRYGLGLENTWANNLSIQIVFDAEDYGEIKNLSATLQLRKQF